MWTVLPFQGPCFSFFFSSLHAGWLQWGNNCKCTRQRPYSNKATELIVVVVVVLCVCVFFFPFFFFIMAT